MSSKIDVREIVSGHFSTMKIVSVSPARISWLDLFIFFGAPLAVAVVCPLLGFSAEKDFISLLVNFGSIFTALLLSVLVLVFDKEATISALPDNPIKALKLNILKELYYNICYAILMSMMVAAVAMLCQITVGEDCGWVNIMHVYFLSPLSIFLVLNVFLTILMIVKRIHTMLTAA